MVFSLEQNTGQDFDLVASRLRSQIRELSRLINTIEQSNIFERSYFCQSLKTIEQEIRIIRKSLERNY
ncbi:MAG: hypothetical protein KC733_07540 [Candidatus Omnitrophica bacterium]|nr:hypothetical protein [Candidatus Omnitrophota bacterium]